MPSIAVKNASIINPLRYNPLKPTINKTGFHRYDGYDIGLVLPFTDTFSVDGAMAAPWLNTAWSKSGGAAVAAVTLGAELVVNGGFGSDTDWTKDAGWTIGSGVASKALGSSAAIYQAILVDGNWYYIFFTVNAVSGSIYGKGHTVYTRPLTSPGVLAGVVRANGINGGAYAYGTPNVSAEIDNATIKQVSLSSTIQLVDTGRNNVSISVLPVIFTDSTQFGAVLCADNATNPQNGIFGHYDRSQNRVRLEKLLVGTWTTLIDVAVTYSAGAIVKVVQTGNTTFQVWYGGTQRGTDVTISDAAIINNTRCGLFATYSGNSFDSVTIEAS